jgi:hypothetical protein
MDDDVFRFSKSILTTKVYQDDVDDNYDVMYNNKILSHHVDCILHVNAVNCNYQQLTPRQNYDYLFHSIRSMRRKYSKWGKNKHDVRIDLIMRYHDYSYQKASQVVDLFTVEQFEKMKKAFDVGG